MRNTARSAQAKCLKASGVFRPKAPVRHGYVHHGAILGNCLLQHPHKSPSRNTSCPSYQPSNQEPLKPRFNNAGFARVRLERVTTTPEGGYGYLVFVRHEARKPWLNGTEQGLIVHITGDTLYCLCKLLRDEPTVRPMPLDLLSSMLMQNASHSGQDWGLIRVAIVGLKQDTYVGRAYFGDRRTGEVQWEHDVRPSDATYLSERWKTPMYVDLAVWDDTALTHDELKGLECKLGWPFDRGTGEETPFSTGVLGQGQGSCSDTLTPALKPSIPEDIAGILDSDPELIKMLKRQMALAIAEENYIHAARIRDSPVLSLYFQLKTSSDDAEAKKQLQAQFDKALSCWDFSS